MKEEKEKSLNGYKELRKIVETNIDLELVKAFNEKVKQKAAQRKEYNKLMDAVREEEVKLEAIGDTDTMMVDNSAVTSSAVTPEAYDGGTLPNHYIQDELAHTAPFDWSMSTFPSTVPEPSVEEAIEEMAKYHASTCSDKYHKAEMDTMNLIMSDDHGKSVNLFNAFKYMSRYMTEGFDKSDNRKDVIKACHYLLFELARTK